MNTPKIIFDFPKDRSSIIKVIGVGGGGSNAVNHMYRQGINGVDFFVCNTDQQALEKSPVPNKIQIGNNLTEGRGAGSNPEMGKKAALESIEEIIDLLGVNTKMIFVTAGMGGGTGTGAAPIIAKTAKELGILTVGIVTTPFSYEGPKRKAQAEDGINALRNAVDSLLIISNDKVKEMYGNLPLRQAFGHADNILTTAAKGIAEIITIGGDMNVDFEDVKTAMTNSGVAILGTGIAEGIDRAKSASEMALHSPLLNDNKIKGAANLLVNISYGDEEVLMNEVTEITEYFQEAAGMGANLKWGHCYDDKLGAGLQVTVIATGFEDRYNDFKPHNTQKVVLPLKNEELEEEPKNEVNPQNTENNAVNSDLFNQPENKAQEKKFIVDFEPPVFSGEEKDVEELSNDRLEALKKRMAYLNNLQNKYNNPQGSQELEKNPAYTRKGVKLDEVPHSSESQISKFSLFDEPEKKTEIKQNNSFLHDNVD